MRDGSALAVIENPNTNVWVTAASAWEIAINSRLGRLDGEALMSAWADIIAELISGTPDNAHANYQASLTH